MEKIKVVFLTHFSNDSIRKRLPLSSGNLMNLFRKNKRRSAFVHSDFAPWVTNLIVELEHKEEIELHVIAPHFFLKNFLTEFEMNGVYYHFFKSTISYYLNIVISKILGDYWRKHYFLSRFIVKKLLEKIKPDIVNLIGSENPHYSITTLDIKNIPVLVSCQTVYSNPDRMKLTGDVVKNIWDLEIKIHKKEMYYCCGGKIHRDLVMQHNPNAIIFRLVFPTTKPLVIDSKISKEYDFVMFGRLIKAKGVEDAIEALALVKKEKPNITLNIVGSCSVEYRMILDELVAAKGLIDNITFCNYFPVHSNLYQHIVKAKYAVLPNKLDVISTTIREAMHLNIPIVTYKTSGTPSLNSFKQCVLLSDIDDFEGLAENMLKLLNSDELASELAANSKELADQLFSDKDISKLLIESYNAVINHYNHGTPVPKELLFDYDVSSLNN